MPLPPPHDLAALLGIDLVVCAGCLRLLGSRYGVSQRAKWGTALCFVVLWLPLGAAHLPPLAFVRGITSDLSITLVALACFGLCQRLAGLPAMIQREKTALNGAIAAAALFLYPMALGWGDWDSYRCGWDAWSMWTALLALSSLAWARGLRLLPLLVGLALLAWSASVLESNNLWDYLVDPWLATAALFQTVRSGAQWASKRFRLRRAGIENFSN